MFSSLCLLSLGLSDLLQLLLTIPPAGGDRCDPRAGELDAAAKFNSEWLHMGTSPGGPHLSLDHGEEQKAGKQTMNEHCSFSMIKLANGSQINPKMH